MKTTFLFVYILMVITTTMTTNIFAQSESSAIKTISPGDVQVTEPMIAPLGWVNTNKNEICDLQHGKL